MSDEPVYLTIEEAENLAQDKIRQRGQQASGESGPVRYTPWGVIQKYLDDEQIGWSNHHATRIEELLTKEGWFFGDSRLKNRDVVRRVKQAYAEQDFNAVMAMMPELLVEVNQLQVAAERLRQIEGS